MMDTLQGRRRRLKLWLALALVVALLAGLIVPPLVSLSRYKSRITHLISVSLGRPVHLSSVELRLLPTPGFVLTDLTVDEDPAYGAEPLLHANTVTASIRLLSLWRGRLEISRISVDEASLNLVRVAAGRWNLDPLFRTAAVHAVGAAGGPSGAAQTAAPLPYLEATNSRINIVNGVEKLPLSLVNTDLSLWQEKPGDWRIRLRGEPARTDVSLESEDTGVVRLEASVQSASELRLMPVHLDLEWREAQLGQLARLMIGSDPGWRGDLTGELHLDGTADAAHITTRLRAIGVHRAEFAPAAPMDFDASCGFVYHYSGRSLDDLACDSPLGDGRIHLDGDLPADPASQHFSVELDRIPLAAGLDALRTVRSGFASGLDAKGAISGKISYAPNQIVNAPPRASHGISQRALRHSANAIPVVQGPLSGSLAIDGFELSGEGLGTPLQVPRLLLTPLSPPPAKLPGRAPQAAAIGVPTLAGSVAVPVGAPAPLAVAAQLTLSGYQVSLRGQAALPRVRELAHVAALADASALDALAGDPVTVDLSATGPWLPPESVPFSNAQPAYAAGAALYGPVSPLPLAANAVKPMTDRLSGTVTLHNANWEAAFLASHVQISQATLHLDNGELSWDPIVFSYGPVKGTASLTLPAACAEPDPCAAKTSPAFAVQFGQLDLSALQAAILGAHERGTLLSELIARLTPASLSAATPWPTLEGTVKADSLLLGPVTLQHVFATVNIQSGGVQIADLDGTLLGGHLHGSANLNTALNAAAKPSYTLDLRCEKLNSSAVGDLLGMHWSGGALDADGKVDLAGYSGQDLAQSASGALHFEWRHGAVALSQQTRHAAGSAASIPVIPPVVPPAVLARFDRWTADASIANGLVTLKPNLVERAGHRSTVAATVTLADPPIVRFDAPKEVVAKQR
jgi:hypothetical protein